LHEIIIASDWRSTSDKKDVMERQQLSCNIMNKKCNWSGGNIIKSTEVNSEINFGPLMDYRWNSK
jgi:hypothetical protein